MRIASIAPLTATALLMTACSSMGSLQQSSAPGSERAPSFAGTEPAGQAPAAGLSVQVLTDALEHGWDIGFLPDGSALVTQRPARIAIVPAGGGPLREVAADLSDVHVAGEGGLLGMVVHPDFATSREFTTCQTFAEGGRPVDIRLRTWRLDESGNSAKLAKNLLTGLPVAESGRHSGCRPEIGPDGSLIVGTGDTARGDVPQDRTRLGGKTLRLNLKTGQPMADNPFIDAPDSSERFVFTYGHRNVQGVAVRPGTDQIFTAEHGPDVDDEVNQLVAGGNYGWDPSQGGSRGGYDESVPMTDTQRYSDAVAAVWSSGKPTEATSDAVFLEGKQWGDREGKLAVTALKGSKLILLTVNDDGSVTDMTIPDELNGTHGRLRAATLGPDGALYLSTSNGRNDELLRVTPTSG